MIHSKVGRNDLCPCGSGKKFKNCCINKKITPPSKPLPFKATLLSQPKEIDLMARTFGSMIQEADKLAEAQEIEELEVIATEEITPETDVEKNS